MIDHDEARTLAAAALDFDLSVEDDQRLLVHMIDCADCRAFAEGLDTDARAVAGLAGEDAPESLRSRILDGLTSDATSDAAPAAVVVAPMPPVRSRAAFSSIPRRYRGPLALTAAAAVVIALVGGTLVWRPTGRPSSSGGPAVAGVSPSDIAPAGSGNPGNPGSTGAPGTPVPTVEPGSRLAASPWTQVADLTADDAPSGVVDLASGFRLTVLDGTPPAEAARRLTVDPPISYKSKADPDGKTVRITPTEPLTPGVAYRFSLAAPDGHEVGTWAFQARQPLRVVGTLPGDTETGVPLNTGIEVTFDQDGVVDAESHVSIAPPVDGRFEQHGRTLAFVPASPLTPATMYTVTVSPGIAVGTTDERLEEGVSFRFETAADGPAAAAATFTFSDILFESSTSDRPIVAVWAFQDYEDEDNPPPPPTSAPIEVYRIDGIEAAMDAYRVVRASPRWSRLSSAGLVPTAGLTQVVALDAHLDDSDGVLWTELPERLPQGWYLIHLASPTKPVQAILQVTDLASYLVVSDTKTLLWANDLATRGPLVGATVALPGTELGRTGADGTLVATTPAGLQPEPLGTCADPCVALITVRDGDRSAFVPGSEPSDPDGKDSGCCREADEALRYWHTFSTDRTLYRATDTVNAWGVVRERDSGKVPQDVTIALTAVNDEYEGAGPALLTRTAHPNAFGAFTTSLGVDDLPEGYYQLELRTGGHPISSTGIQIGRILKPAYQLEVTTGRRVYVAGDLIRITARASFYEGTPVPGIALRTEGAARSTFTTDATGTASRKVIARVGGDEDEQEVTDAEVQEITVTPARAEEGEIYSPSREILVFPSHWTIGATATVGDGQVRVSGTLSEIARDRLEREIGRGEDPWSADPAGKAMADRTVTLTIYDNTTVRVQRGTRYDFIEKKVIPTYDYDTHERVADTIRVRTDSKGRFSASIPASDGHGYRIRVTARDSDGHTARWMEWANEPFNVEASDRAPALTLTADDQVAEASFGVGDTVDVEMSDPTAAGEGDSDRYLFTTAQRGLRDVVVQDSARFRTTFDRSAAPSLRIDAVRFNGSRYSITTSFQAFFDTSERALTVGLSTDAGRYAPGADVRLGVTTRDASGDPVAATVVLRAVDEKLFTLGGAVDADPLAELYGAVESGIRVIYRSHRPPREADFGGGDTGGGGRDDFRDSLLFTSVETGSDGRASVTMHLSDDLTSWHVSASAIGAGLTGGGASIRVPVGLPFFVDATIAPEYLVSDRPDIGLRAFGTALDPGSRVRFAVESDTLGLHVSGLAADAFETIHVRLPALSLGRHKVTITARTGSGADARVDRLTRTFIVIGSRLERTRTTYQEITGVSHVEGGRGVTEITVADAGVGRYAPLLLGLAETNSGRLENALAAAVAGSLAETRFDAAGTAADAFDGRAYQTGDGGLTVVPFASSDLEASVLAALVSPERFDAARLRIYLTAVAHDPKETRERRVYALAGLAGVRAGVLPEIRTAAADPDLTIRERLMLGIGAAALGDASTAHAIATSLIESYGEAGVGDQARLRVGSDAADVTRATALMAMLAAANDDPLATRFWAYVEANPDEDATYALHAVGFVSRLLDHARPAAGTFAYVSGGKRTVVKLEPGEAFHLTLVPSQVPAFTIERVSGTIALTSSWREPVDPAAFDKDPDVTISRTIKPSKTIETRDLVTVDLVVDLGQRANTGCLVVTDYAPSGLVPVARLRSWADDEDPEGLAANVTLPYSVVGQRVDFCAESPADGRPVRLRYLARVITTGTYTWETAIAQSPIAPDRSALTGPTKITID